MRKYSERVLRVNKTPTLRASATQTCGKDCCHATCDIQACSAFTGRCSKAGVLNPKAVFCIDLALLVDLKNFGHYERNLKLCEPAEPYSRIKMRHLVKLQSISITGSCGLVVKTLVATSRGRGFKSYWGHFNIFGNFKIKSNIKNCKY